jgi:hypothetical protein
VSKSPWRRDFTVGRYRELLIALLQSGYTSWNPFDPQERENPLTGKRLVMLRHDVDKPSRMTETLAALENHFGLRAVYYFRRGPRGFDTEVIGRVSSLGHAIGYHYETLCKSRGDFPQAIELFRKELAELRRMAPVTTACMHGSPLSKWDNRRLWERYDYRELNIRFDPYFDLDFNQVLYLTDTGRKWNGQAAVIRDRVPSGFRLEMKTTADIVRALNRGTLPDRVMISSHPHRWDDRPSPWLRELFWQNIKNVGKSILGRLRPQATGVKR